MDMHTSHRQDGAALFVGLLLLLVMTMIGVGAMSNINIEERMAGNQKRMADAQMAAEAGVKDFYEWVNWDFQSDPDSDCSEDCVTNRWSVDNVDAWRGVFPDSETGTANYGDVGYYWVQSWERWNIDQEEHGRLHVRGQAKAPATTRTLSDLQLEALFRKVTGENCDLSAEARALVPALAALPPEVILPACGIVTEGQVLLNNEANLVDANLHSNSNIEQSVYVSSESSTIDGGHVTAVGEVEVPEAWWDQGVVFEGTDPMEIPMITDSMLDTWREIADVVLADCGNPADGPLDMTAYNGQMVFCEGDAWIEGRFNNVTLIVNGNLVHDGALRDPDAFDSLAETNLIAARGDITFNGATGTARQEFHGIFWSNGTFRQNGRAYVIGAVMAAEAELADGLSDALFDGNLEFEGLRNKDFMSLSHRLAIVGWRQVWD